MIKIKRPAFFGKLMKKEPNGEILVDRYHQVNKLYDDHPDRQLDITAIKGGMAICSNGDKIPLVDP